MFSVNEELCIGCRQCVMDCPVADIYMTDHKKAHIKNENCISCGHCVAICPKYAVSTDSYSMDDVIPYDKESFTVEPSNLMNFMKFRRTVRRFKDKKVDKDQLQQIIEAGRFCPTSTNSQDVSYIVLDESLGQVKEQMYEILKAKGEYILSHLTSETEHLKRYATLWVGMYERYHNDKKASDRLFLNAPSAILVTAKNPTNGALASSYMELMINSLGLGCCYNGFAIVAVDGQSELQKSLGVEEGSTIISCLVVGQPDVTYKRTVPRKQAQVSWK